MNKTSSPEDTLEAVNEFLSRAGQRNSQRTPQQLNPAYRDMLLPVTNRDTTDVNGSLVNSDEVPFGPNPFLTGDAREVYDMLRERIQQVKEKKEIISNRLQCRL